MPKQLPPVLTVEAWQKQQTALTKLKVVADPKDLPKLLSQLKQAWLAVPWDDKDPAAVVPRVRVVQAKLTKIAANASQVAPKWRASKVIPRAAREHVEALGAAALTLERGVRQDLKNKGFDPDARRRAALTAISNLKAGIPSPRQAGTAPIPTALIKAVDDELRKLLPFASGLAPWTNRWGKLRALTTRNSADPRQVLQHIFDEADDLEDDVKKVR